MLKGGMLLTYTLGVQNRSTQDIDFLIKGVRLDSVEIKKFLTVFYMMSLEQGYGLRLQEIVKK